MASISLVSRDIADSNFMATLKRTSFVSSFQLNIMFQTLSELFTPILFWQWHQVITEYSWNGIYFTISRLDAS